MNDNNKGYLFSVEVMIEAATNGQALEKLLHLLNSELVRDYRIKNGIDLGKLIEMNSKENHGVQIEIPRQSNLVLDQLDKFKADHTLIRLTVIKGKGIKLSLPCRILNIDTGTQYVTVYHVDEKKVYQFKLNEIDDFTVS